MQVYDIDLYSDTKTRPTHEMREIIARAEVGDEQHNECPTVNRLLEKVAPLLGQEAAMFLAVGTMANQIAVLVHCRPGDELYGHASAHIINYEGGAPAALAGASARVLGGDRGIYARETLREAMRPKNRYAPASRLAVVEQTTNAAGGTVWSLDEIRSVADEARVQGLALHMDGARLMNASVATNIAPSAFGSAFDSVYLDFTKGLGCPMGAVLAGSRDFIDQAWRWKQRLGGSMRQAGMMAAACLYALDHNVDRLKVDHDNARLLGEELAKIPGMTVGSVETNIVFADVSELGVSSEQFLQRLRPHGVRGGIYGDKRLRFVTHLDVDHSKIMRAVEVISAEAEACRSAGRGS